MTTSGDLFAAATALGAGARVLSDATDRHTAFRRKLVAITTDLQEAWTSPDSEIVKNNADLLIADMEPITAALTRASDASLTLSRKAEQIGGELAEIERQMATFASPPTRSALEPVGSDQGTWNPFPDGPANHRAQLEQQRQEQVRRWNLAHAATCDELGPEVATIDRLATLSWIMPDLSADRSGVSIDPGGIDRLNDLLSALAGGAGSHPGPEFILLHQSEITPRLTHRPDRPVRLNNGKRVWVVNHAVADAHGRGNYFMIQNPRVQRWALVSRSAGALSAGLTIYNVASEEHDRVDNDPSLTEAERVTSVSGATAIEGGITIAGGLAGAKQGALWGGLLGSKVPLVGNAVGFVVGGAIGGFVGSRAGNAVGSWFWDQVGPPVTSAGGWVGDRVDDAHGWVSDGLQSLSSFARLPRL